MTTRKDNNNRSLKKGESQRKNGTYCYRCKTKNHESICIYAKTLPELRQKEQDIQRDIIEGNGLHKNKNITINDMFDKWEKLKRGIKSNTKSNYVYMYKKFVMNDFGKKFIVDIKRTDIKTFYLCLVDEEGMKPNTVDSINTVLHQVLEMAIDDDVIRANPCDNALKELKLSHRDFTSKKRALTIEEEKILLSFLKNGNYTRWYPLCYFLLNTGLRIGEATALQWSDIDFENKLIKINRTLVYFDKGNISKGRCVYELHSTKTESGKRIVPVNDEVLDVLKQERQFQADLGITCQSSIKNIEDGVIYDDFVFLGRFGDVMNSSTINKAWHRMTKYCNEDILSKSKAKNPVLVPKFSSHILRHTYCTRLIEAGISQKVVQRVMGHSDIQTTMNIYADATNDFIVENIAAYFDYSKANGI